MASNTVFASAGKLSVGVGVVFEGRANLTHCCMRKHCSFQGVKQIIHCVCYKKVFSLSSLSLRRECDEESYQSVRPWAAPRPSRCRPCPTMRRDAARPTATETSSLVSSHVAVNKIFTGTISLG